jgi:hypothetical protein
MQINILKITGCLLIFFSQTLLAQPGSHDPDKVSKKAMDLYEKAIEMPRMRNTVNPSLPFKAIKIDKRFAMPIFLLEDSRPIKNTIHQ